MNLDRTGKIMTALGWLLALGVLTYGFSEYLARERNPNRAVQSRTHDGGIEVRLQQNRFGHYYVGGYINGEAVEFVVDTGATQVSVPAHLADRLKLRAGPPVPVGTANGTVTVYLTRLDEVRVGDIAVRDVKAHLNPGMDGDEILLGMSFLRELEFTQRGDTLTLRQAP